MQAGSLLACPPGSVLLHPFRWHTAAQSGRWQRPVSKSQARQILMVSCTTLLRVVSSSSLKEMKSFCFAFSRTDSWARKVKEQSPRQEKAAYSSATTEEHPRPFSVLTWLLTPAGGELMATLVRATRVGYTLPTLQGRWPGAAPLPHLLSSLACGAQHTGLTGCPFLQPVDFLEVSATAPEGAEYKIKYSWAQGPWTPKPFLLPEVHGAPGSAGISSPLSHFPIVY